MTAAFRDDQRPVGSTAVSRNLAWLATHAPAQRSPQPMGTFQSAVGGKASLLTLLWSEAGVRHKIIRQNQVLREAELSHRMLGVHRTVSNERAVDSDLQLANAWFRIR